MVGEALNRHDFWRAGYATMLSEWRPEDIREFLLARPLTVENRTYAGADLAALLWNEKGFVTTAWNYDGVNALEPFMVERGYDPFHFIRRLLFRNNGATYMPGKVILGWFYPLMDKVFNRYDPREMVFNLIAVFTETYLPHHVHRRIRKSRDGEWTLSFLMYATDKTFQSSLDLNFDLIAGEQIKAAPRILDLPEFDDVTYIADCRSPESVLGEGDFNRDEQGLHLDGRLIARPESFFDFASRWELDIKGYKVPDREVLVAGEDVFCPRRNRVVIYRDCAYQAPAYISRVRHKKIANKDRRLIQHLVTDSLLEEDLFSPEIRRRHLEMIKSLEKRLVFEYWDRDESITLNGEHLTKGVPAKILRHILLAVREGRSEFEYREFKRDFEISMGQKNSNFEVRFYRLIEKLEEKCAELRIERAERGRFNVRIACPMELVDAVEEAHG